MTDTVVGRQPAGLHGSRARRQREKEELRRVILDAARDLFVAQGYEQVTLRKIAQRIHYSHTAIYTHFQDKVEILMALSEEGFSLLLESMRAVEEADPIANIKGTSRAYWEFAVTHPHYYRIMFLLECNPMVRCLPEDTYGFQTYCHIVKCVETAQAAGRFDPAENSHVIAHVLWARIHGLASLCLAERLGTVLPAEVTVEHVAARSVELVVAGFERSAS